MSEEERKEQDGKMDQQHTEQTEDEEKESLPMNGDHPAAEDVHKDGSSETVESAQEQGVVAEGDSSSKPVLSPLIVPSPTILSNHAADDMHAPDSPTTSLISALRLSLQQLTEQSHQLNTKLVTSFSRVADLEGTIDELREDNDHRARTLQELEREKAQWEESMKTGLLVERDQIRDEMQRLAAGLVEEERRRGSAELGREKLEGEVDVLTATLFDQANTMVATERHGRVQAETRLKLAEDNLSVAEAAVRDMQVHLQSLSSAPPEAQSSQLPLPQQHRLLTSHVPYNEFIAFINHIRMLRPQKQSSMSYYPPTPVSALLSQPFLARAVTEDHEPCLRLDVAPDLSWLSRRSVAAAIIAGELMIEPVSASTVLGATSTPAHELTCSLCSKYVFPNASAPTASPLLATAPPAHPMSKTGTSTSRFSLKLFSNTSAPTSPSPAPPSPNPSVQSLGSVYVFRIAPAATSTQASTDAKSYPLCRSGWCLERLRATCAFWHFVRSGLIQVVWKAEDATASGSSQPVAVVDEQPAAQPPSLPPRKKSWGLGFKTSPSSTPASGSWGLGFRGAGMSPPISPRITSDASQDAYIGEKDAHEAERETKVDEKSDAAEAVTSSAVVDEGPVVDLNDNSAETTNSENETAVDAEGAVPVIVAEAINSNDSEEPVEVITASEDHLDAMAPKSSASSMHGSDGEEASFSTPKGTNAELSPAPSNKDLGESNDDVSSETTAEAKQDADQAESDGASHQEQPKADEEGTAPAIVDLTSPEVPSNEKVDDSSALPESAAASPASPSTAAAPPPVPRRAAARPRPASRIIDGETASGAATPSHDGTMTPAVPEDAEPHSDADVSAEGPTATDASVDHTTSESAPPLPARSAVPPSLPPRSTAPPSLPPRETTQSTLPAPALPSRDKLRPTSLTSATGKTYAEGEEWEVKTWREIIKLKEAMWKARVGVEDVEA